MADFGLTNAGFKAMALSEIRTDLQAAMRQSFGDNVNLDSRSVLGNLVDIFAERYAALWQLAQGIYGSTSIGEATGLGVDNILALNNLTRIRASASRTAPTPALQSNGITFYGLVVFGDPGTVVAKGALISDGLAAPTTFSIDAPIAIGPSSNAQQTLTFSNVPDAGAFSLTLTDPTGAALTTPLLPKATSAAQMQAAVLSLARADGVFPFTDVLVSAQGTGYVFDFGAGTVATGQPKSSATAIPLVTVASNTLRSGTAVTNITILEPRVGAPAQGVGSATALFTGPQAVQAGALTTIVTPQAGWKGVTNQLDVITGADDETDSQALARMASLRAAQGSASLASIVERVKQVAGVTACIGFENKTSAAVQEIAFSQAPTTGAFALATAGGQTASIAAPCSASSIQAALAGIPTFESALVSGTGQAGFSVDFRGSQGGQPQPLLAVVNNTTDAQATVAFGRPAHAVEIVTDGGDTDAVAAAILASLPAGVTAWGHPALRTLGSVSQGSASLTVASALKAAPGQIATMPSLPFGTSVVSVSGLSLTTDQVGQSTVSNAPLILQDGALVSDSQGNAHLVTFTRPIKTLIYVSVALITDAHVQPGVVTSATNPTSQWSPASVTAIQSAVADVINQTPIGGTIIINGTRGVASSFRDIAGVVDFDLRVDLSSPPSNRDNLPLQAAQSAVCELANVAVSWS